MNIELKKWLETPCDLKDLKELEPTIYYMPIGVVKSKIKFMEDNFEVTVFESNFHHFLFNANQRESFASGSIEIKIVSTDGSLISQLVGAATFPLPRYDQNTHYAATLESLCIVNAFGGKYPQFGSALNSLDVVSPASTKLATVPKEEVDVVMKKLFDKVKKKIVNFPDQESATEYLNTIPEFKHSIVAKQLILGLPLRGKGE